MRVDAEKDGIARLSTDAVYALNEIQRNAALQRFELERGNVDGFAELMTAHWELSKGHRYMERTG